MSCFVYTVGKAMVPPQEIFLFLFNQIAQGNLTASTIDDDRSIVFCIAINKREEIIITYCYQRKEISILSSVKLVKESNLHMLNKQTRFRVYFCTFNNFLRSKKKNKCQNSDLY